MSHFQPEERATSRTSETDTKPGGLLHSQQRHYAPRLETGVLAEKWGKKGKLKWSRTLASMDRHFFSGLPPTCLYHVEAHAESSCHSVIRVWREGVSCVVHHPILPHPQTGQLFYYDKSRLDARSGIGLMWSCSVWELFCPQTIRTLLFMFRVFSPSNCPCVSTTVAPSSWETQKTK